jgi:diguanylate cyclase (GGDEF)-like protein
MGRQAVIDLCDRLEGKAVYSRRFPVRYVPRRSCGCTAVSQEATPETIDFLRRQRRHLARELAQARQEGIDFQRKSWFIPFFARDLNNYADNDVLYCRQIMVNLKLISSRNMYLFLLDAPLQYAEGSTWTAPEEMLLASYCKDGKIVSYYPYDRPKVSRNHPLSEYLNDEQAHQYSFFLLFSGEKQYGLLACDIEQEDFQFFYAVSLQLGLALRYHEIGRTEAAHVQEMSRLIDLMRERNQELDMLSSFDKLTGLLNLRGCLEKMQGLRPKNSSQHAYLIYSDLDHLKEINDTWGHQEGDYAICAAGQILKSNLRDSDILGRIGGDEFVGLILSDSPTLENTLRRRIDDSCRNLNAVSDKPYYVEISLGITSFDYTPDTDIQEIISLADHMLYEHKKFRRTSIRKNT